MTSGIFVLIFDMMDSPQGAAATTKYLTPFKSSEASLSEYAMNWTRGGTTARKVGCWV